MSLILGFILGLYSVLLFEFVYLFLVLDVWVLFILILVLFCFMFGLRIDLGIVFRITSCLYMFGNGLNIYN